jgi:hypothetical protein
VTPVSPGVVASFTQGAARQRGCSNSSGADLGLGSGCICVDRLQSIKSFNSQRKQSKD